MSQLSLYTAAHSLTNIFYVLRKEFPVAERKQVISLLCSICNIVSISSENITKAIDSGITDDLVEKLAL